jgi:amino-acid N-acetyltransferase
MPMVEIHMRPQMRIAATLLESAQLPASDLTEAHLDHFFFSGTETSPSGLVGLEFCAGDVLLRSLVVCPEFRFAGLGGALVRHAESYARACGVRSIFLLTTSAEAFFERRGYARAARASAPEAVRNTREFAAICSASAAFMVKQLQSGAI